MNTIETLYSSKQTNLLTDFHGFQGLAVGRCHKCVFTALKKHQIKSFRESASQLTPRKSNNKKSLF